MTGLGGRLARGAGWSIAGTVSSRALALAVSVITARFLGKADFGAFGVISSTTGMFLVFAGFGLGATATKHVAELRRADPARAGRILGLSLALSWITGALAALALYLAAPWLAGHALGAPELAPALRISAAGLLFSTALGAETGALAGFEAFRAVAVTSLAAGVLSFGPCILGVARWGLTGALWAQSLSAALQWGLARAARRAKVREAGLRLWWRGWGDELRLLWSFSLPALVTGVMVTPVSWACSAMVVNLPGGFHEMGAFNAANQWFGAILLLPGAATAALLPVLSERIGAGDLAGARALLRSAVLATAAVVVPAAAVLAVASPAVMRLYGPSFASAWPTLAVVVGTGALAAVLSPAGVVLTASSRLWTGLLMNAGWATVFLGATWRLGRLGAIGLASARLVAYGAHAVWTALVAWGLMRDGRRPAAAEVVGGAP